MVDYLANVAIIGGEQILVTYVVAVLLYIIQRKLKLDLAGIIFSFSSLVTCYIIASSAITSSNTYKNKITDRIGQTTLNASELDLQVSDKTRKPNETQAQREKSFSENVKY